MNIRATLAVLAVLLLLSPLLAESGFWDEFVSGVEQAISSAPLSNIVIATNFCASSSSRRCYANGSYQTCNGGTHVWNTAVSCLSPAFCSNGFCVQCGAGQSRCGGSDPTTMRQTCVNGAWGNTSSCYWPFNYCQDGGCVLCINGATRCTNDSRIQACASNLWSAAQFCPSGQSCSNGRCATPAPGCTTGARRCLSSSQPQYCERGAWYSASACTGAATCSGGYCNASAAAPVCTPGARSCYDISRPLQCDAAGRNWNFVTPCANQTSCRSGVCESWVGCTLNANRCFNSTRPQRCVSWNNATAWSDLTDCSNGASCVNGVCTGGAAGAGGACTLNSVRCLNTTQPQICSNSANGTRWFNLPACVSGTACSDMGTCVSQSGPGGLCATGSRRCYNSSLPQLCSNGAWLDTSGCLSGTVCSNGSCVTAPGTPSCAGGQACPPGLSCFWGTTCLAPCTPGEVICYNGTARQQCVAIGVGANWANYAACPANTVCQGPGGNCVFGLCVSNTKRCLNAQTPQICFNGASGLRWFNQSACPAGTVCSNGNCVPGAGPVTPVCTPNSGSCVNNATIQTCSSDGLGWQAPAACPANSICSVNICIPLPGPQPPGPGCTPGTSECINSTILSSCSAAGQWANTVCPGTQVCQAGSCITPPVIPACTPGETQCTGDDTLSTCSAAGTWASVTCPGSLVCRDGDCVAPPVAGGCTPGTRRCSDAYALQTCGADGTWDDSSCAAGLLCIDNACQAPPAGACNLGDARCLNNRIWQLCNAAGQWDDRLLRDCPFDTVCRNGTCVSSAPPDRGVPLQPGDTGAGPVSPGTGGIPPVAPPSGGADRGGSRSATTPPGLGSGGQAKSSDPFGGSGGGNRTPINFTSPLEGLPALPGANSPWLSWLPWAVLLLVLLLLLFFALFLLLGLLAIAKKLLSRGQKPETINAAPASKTKKSK